MLYFREDGAGGWTRLETRLGNNNLKFVGSLVPTIASAVPDALQDLLASVITEGAVDAVLLQKPLTFTKLLKRLEAKGLIRPTLPPSQRPTSPQEHNASAAHRAEVPIKYL